MFCEAKNVITVAAVRYNNSIINITIGSKLVEAMLDSGSTISLIRQDTVSTMTVNKYLPLPPHNLVTASDGHAICHLIHLLFPLK